MLTDVQPPVAMKAKLRALRTVYPVPFAGQTLYVRALTIAELNALYTEDAEVETRKAEADDLKITFAKRLLAASVCDELGGAVFTGAEDPDFEHIATDALKVLSEAAAERNGLTGSGND